MLNRIRSFGVLGGALAVALGTVAACDDPFAQCREGFNCPGDDEGPISGGSSPGGENAGGSANSGGSKSGGSNNSGGEASSSGGTSSGGAPSGGMGGEASGGAPPEPCYGKCKGDRPFCDEGDDGVADDKCVGCLEHTDCKDLTKPMCLESECVPCLDDFSCKDTLGLEDTPTCLDGTEDEDTGEVRPETGACAECGRSSDCGGAICDGETLTCIDGTLYKGRDVCEECTDDRECKDGQVCVATEFTDPTPGPVGSFCLWRKDATQVAAPNGTCGLNSRPYAKLLTVTTMSGAQNVEVCAPRSTTCSAIAQFSEPVAGCDAEGDDEACGAEGFNDGLCRLRNGTDPLCTYPCGGSDDSDCPKGFSCKAGGDRHCDL
jgi:hypothetical protein